MKNLYRIDYKNKVNHPQEEPYSREIYADNEQGAIDSFNRDRGNVSDILKIEMIEENVTPSAFDNAFHS